MNSLQPNHLNKDLITKYILKWWRLGPERLNFQGENSTRLPRLHRSLRSDRSHCKRGDGSVSTVPSGTIALFSGVQGWEYSPQQLPFLRPTPQALLGAPTL